MYLGFLVVAGIIALYIGTYVLNKRTPAPEGCEVAISEATCGACTNYSCGIKQEYAKGEW